MPVLLRKANLNKDGEKEESMFLEVWQEYRVSVRRDRCVALRIEQKVIAAT